MSDLSLFKLEMNLGTRIGDTYMGTKSWSVPSDETCANATETAGQEIKYQPLMYHRTSCTCPLWKPPELGGWGRTPSLGRMKTNQSLQELCTSARSKT